MAEANRFLAERFIPAHNQSFREPPGETGSAFVPWIGHGSAGTLADLLSVQEERTVGNDNTVRYRNRSLQIPADRHRHHYVKCRVRVHEYPDGAFAVFHGSRCLARYTTTGSLIETTAKAA